LFPGNNIPRSHILVKIVSRKLFCIFDILGRNQAIVKGDIALPPSPEGQVEPVIAEIMSLLSKVSEKLEPENLGMKKWIVQNFNNPKIAELLQDSTFMMLRVLDAIGRLEPVNGITISKQFRIPKGSVSKATRRLITKKLVKTESLPNNKKEILYRTTPLGKELFQAHRAFDKQLERGFVRFLQKYDEDELRFIVRVLHDVTEISFLNLESLSN
jgi:DNA-binding MarR family transcriptional regulator